MKPNYETLKFLFLYLKKKLTDRDIQKNTDMKSDLINTKRRPQPNKALRITHSFEIIKRFVVTDSPFLGVSNFRFLNFECR